ncbi:MAG: PLDc N-terminal domain-containing protein [Candidatus Dormibacteraeota bacterium]|nr:PLDc N-terminal domain-containing protein [Candidatus Dormibacteraeota bacterium]
MKLIFEILLSIFLHPIAFILCVINIVGRSDLNGVQKVLWILVTFVWGLGPILYVLLGDGSLW